MPRLSTPDRPMFHLGHAIRPGRAPTPAEATEIIHVRELAVEFAAGRLPIEEVQRLSSGPTRWLATRFTPPDHPAFGPLMRTLDALIHLAGISDTRQGSFTKQDLIDVEAKTVYENGKALIVFPVRYRWLVKPDRDKGIAGIRGEAVFRPVSTRGPTYKPLDHAPRPVRLDVERLWWQDHGDA